MLLRYVYDRHLAQASYLVGCQQTGEALVIDPHRLVDDYLALAAEEGLRITAVTETHIHADFASGARALAAATGATLYLSDKGGAAWSYDFAHYSLRDGDRITLGNLELAAWHTPGHTPEHLVFVLTDHGAAVPMGVFSGDALFVGDIGRPDLLETATGIAASKEPAAHALWHSVQRLKTLPDYLQIWPGHGAGSACGKALGAIPTSTIGYERRQNWAMRETDEQQFVATVLDGQPEPPRYFREMKQLNRAGAALPTRSLASEHAPERLAELLAAHAVVIDTREREAYGAAHHAGTLNIAWDKSFATWAGTLLPYDAPLYLIAHAASIESAAAELARIGLDNLAGWWNVATLPPGTATIPWVSAAEMEQMRVDGSATILDVRRTNEWDAGHLPGVTHIPLQTLVDRLDEVPRREPLLIHCASGVRSAMAASLLRARGWRDVRNVRGGFGAWEKLER